MNKTHHEVFIRCSRVFQSTLAINGSRFIRRSKRGMQSAAKSNVLREMRTSLPAWEAEKFSPVMPVACVSGSAISRPENDQVDRADSQACSSIDSRTQRISANGVCPTCCCNAVGSFVFRASIYDCIEFVANQVKGFLSSALPTSVCCVRDPVRDQN